MKCCKLSAIVTMYFTIFTLIYVVVYYNRLFTNYRMLITKESMKQHTEEVKRYYDARRNWVTSNLGTYLFKYNDRKPYVITRHPEEGSFFNVLIWRHWEWLKQRHAEAYGTNIYDPLSGCSVSNCRFSGDHVSDDTTFADAVVVNVQKGILPDFTSRLRADPDQLWIFWVDESPKNTFSVSRGNRLSFSQMAKYFNWSMTYRSDSDVPVPYGRTVPLPYPRLNEITNQGLMALVPYWNEKETDVLAANVMSRCVKFRLQFLKRLQRFISIDVYGSCAGLLDKKRRCPGHFRADCPVISKYLFYVVMENSKCRQYISEKIFHHAFKKGAIPIIMGAPLHDCTMMLPPNSFIHRENYKSLKDLGRDINLISFNMTKLLSYHAWRNNFEILEEHGFLGTRSFALCRICEALNYNDPSRKVYSTADIRMFLDPKVCCMPSN